MSGSQDKTQMSKEDSERIQRTQEETGAGSFAARAQAAGDKYQHAQAEAGKAGQTQGGSKVRITTGCCSSARSHRLPARSMGFHNAASVTEIAGALAARSGKRSYPKKAQRAVRRPAM